MIMLIMSVCHHPDHDKDAWCWRLWWCTCTNIYREEDHIVGDHLDDKVVEVHNMVVEDLLMKIWWWR